MWAAGGGGCLASGAARGFSPSHVSPGRGCGGLLHGNRVSTFVGALAPRRTSTTTQGVPHARSRVAFHSTRISAMSRADLLKGVSNENKDVVARVIEQAEGAVRSWDTKHTRFLTPPEMADCRLALSRLGEAEVGSILWGGYPQAERCRLTLGRPEMLDALAPGWQERAGGEPTNTGSVAAVRVEGNFLFDPATHRDFLGSALGTGLERWKIGDILIQGEKGAEILIDESLAPFLEVSLTSVRSVPVKTAAIPLEKLTIREPKVDQMRTTEASMRLDSIASAGFRLSRSKMADLVKAGDVRVNWQGVKKGSVVVGEGDVISVAGKGRLEVGEVSITKKERFAVMITRFQ